MYFQRNPSLITTLETGYLVVNVTGTYSTSATVSQFTSIFITRISVLHQEYNLSVLDIKQAAKLLSGMFT